MGSHHLQRRSTGDPQRRDRTGPPGNALTVGGAASNGSESAPRWMVTTATNIRGNVDPTPPRRDHWDVQTCLSCFVCGSAVSVSMRNPSAFKHISSVRMRARATAVSWRLLSASPPFHGWCIRMKLRPHASPSRHTCGCRHVFAIVGKRP